MCKPHKNHDKRLHTFDILHFIIQYTSPVIPNIKDQIIRYLLDHIWNVVCHVRCNRPCLLYEYHEFVMASWHGSRNTPQLTIGNKLQLSTSEQL